MSVGLFICLELVLQYFIDAGSLVLCPNTCFLCHNIMSNFHELYPGWKFHILLFAVYDPISAHWSIIETVDLQLGSVCVDICRNVRCHQMKLACAWRKEVFSQYVSASFLDPEQVVHMVGVFLWWLHWYSPWCVWQFPACSTVSPRGWPRWIWCTVQFAGSWHCCIENAWYCTGLSYPDVSFLLYSLICWYVACLFGWHI